MIKTKANLTLESKNALNNSNLSKNTQSKALPLANVTTSKIGTKESE